MKGRALRSAPNMTPSRWGAIESCAAAAEAASLQRNWMKAMDNPPAYSRLFSCLHDEASPVGNLGRGTHFSIFRSVEWLDVERQPLARPQIHDFAVIWDENTMSV